MHSFPFCFDLSAVRNDLFLLVAESRGLAAELRRTWTRPMAEEQRSRARIAKRITELLVLVALGRGRIHVRTRPRGMPSDTPWDPESFAASEALRVAAPYATGEASDFATAQVAQ